MKTPPRPAAAQALPVPGDVIAGKYAIVKVLGEGGMGIVFEARHLRLRQRVAVKMLLPSMLEHEIIVTRFEREARAAAQLRNRHTARVMDVDVTPDGLPYMVMELLDGHDLQRELDERRQLSREEAVDYVLQACSAMIEAHQHGIIHRDLKPANLFLANDGDVRIVKVLDFGVSKLLDDGDAKLTGVESVMGTALYMSPEQIRSSAEVDARTDIWSLGVILYELMSGRPPWVGTVTQLAAAIVTEDAPDIRSLCQVPAEVATIIAKALERDPDRRFADVKQLAFALAPFAPTTGAGRIIAEGLLHGAASSGSFPRVSITPARFDDAPTIDSASAASGSRGYAEGTAPGWSQHNAPKARSRAVVVGFLLAFGGGLLVIGLLVFGWMRLRPDPPANRSVAGTLPSTASSAPPSVAPAIAPPPQPIVPPLPVTGQVSAAPAASAAPVRPAGPAVGPRRGPASPAGKPDVKPAPTPSGNPLLL